MKKRRFEKTICSLCRNRVFSLKTAGWVPLALLVFVFFAWVQPVQAEQKTIEIPKAARIQKLGPGHFKFVLPNNRLVELRGLNPRTGEAGSIEVIDPTPPHKPLAGKQVKLNLKRLTPAQAGKLAGHNFVQIDDDIAWLPLSITFQSTEPEAEPSPVKPGAAPMKPNTTLAPSVVAPALPIRIDSIRTDPEWLKEGQSNFRLHVSGTRTVAGETLHATIDIIRNGSRTRTALVRIGGTAGPFFFSYLIDYPFVPGTYQVKVKYGSQSYMSREFQTEARHRFPR